MTSKALRLNKGQAVRVMRQIGKNGVPTEVTGVIERFPTVMTIGGEATAIVKHDDDGESYWYALSKITPLSQ